MLAVLDLCSAGTENGVTATIVDIHPNTVSRIRGAACGCDKHAKSVRQFRYRSERSAPRVGQRRLARSSVQCVHQRRWSVGWTSEAEAGCPSGCAQIRPGDTIEIVATVTDDRGHHNWRLVSGPGGDSIVAIGVLVTRTVREAAGLQTALGRANGSTPN